MTRLQTLGESTLQPEITNISSYGVWLLSNDKELFMAFEDFPWFKDMPVGKIINVEEPTPGHF